MGRATTKANPKDSVLENGVKWVLLSHNTKLGAAKGAISVAEYLLHTAQV